MSKLEGKNLRVVLYEGSSSARLEQSDRFEIFSALLNKGFDVTRAATNGGVPPSDGAQLFVIGRFPNGAPSVAPTASDGTPLQFQDITDLSTEEIVSRAKSAVEDNGTRALGLWKPWFPVIDYDRCTNCMQCLTFCLFDVYGVNHKDEIQVQHQDHCKTDCPACSRVCPEVAILFPKYKKGPINGDVVRKEDIQREAMKVDVSALLGGDIYSSLRSRQKNARERFSTERDESRALIERKKCLKKLKADLDIPDEVLMTLPSVGDIQERAQRAKAKLARRQSRSQTISDQQKSVTAEEWGI